jgi:hypothetical protein
MKSIVYGVSFSSDLSMNFHAKGLIRVSSSSWAVQKVGREHCPTVAGQFGSTRTCMVTTLCLHVRLLPLRHQ